VTFQRAGVPHITSHALAAVITEQALAPSCVMTQLRTILCEQFAKSLLDLKVHRRQIGTHIFIDLVPTRHPLGMRDLLPAQQGLEHLSRHLNQHSDSPEKMQTLGPLLKPT
jgi:hypothetical protein